ncbi:MAG TPA: hydrogenase maturation protease [Chloroflexota bacterium]|nr:hydrogenase maturation protease [Chloroflexota bacterium]
MTEQRVLVAGIGNIFLGDDAFGVEVVRRLVARPLPDGVRVADFGIRGFDLAYALLDAYDLAILVDALPRGGAPGTLYVLEPDVAALDAASAVAVDAHTIDPVQVLCLVKAMDGQPRRILVVGCEPATLDADEEGAMGLSAPVQAAVDEAVGLVEAWIARALGEPPGPARAGGGAVAP